MVEGVLLCKREICASGQVANRRNESSMKTYGASDVAVHDAFAYGGNHPMLSYSAPRSEWERDGEHAPSPQWTSCLSSVVGRRDLSRAFDVILGPQQYPQQG